MDKVLEGLALGTASPECLLLLHTRADVRLHLHLVWVYLLKLAQNLLNELLCQLSLYLLRYSLALSSHDRPNNTCTRLYLHLCIAVNHCTYIASLGGCSKYSPFCPVYYFIWAYWALLHALPLPARIALVLTCVYIYRQFCLMALPTLLHMCDMPMHHQHGLWQQFGALQAIVGHNPTRTLKIPTKCTLQASVSSQFCIHTRDACTAILNPPTLRAPTSFFLISTRKPPPLQSYIRLK